MTFTTRSQPTKAADADATLSWLVSPHPMECTGPGDPETSEPPAPPEQAPPPPEQAPPAEEFPPAAEPEVEPPQPAEEAPPPQEFPPGSYA